MATLCLEKKALHNTENPSPKEEVHVMILASERCTSKKP
jgi:hypothetical protein